MVASGILVKKVFNYFLCSILFALICAQLSQAEVSAEIIKNVKEDISELSLKEQKYSLLVGTGLTLGALFFDEEIKKGSTNWKSGANKAVSDFGNFVGNPIIDFSVSALLYASAKKDSTLEKASFTALESVFLSAAVTETIAYSVGRKRPNQNESNTVFKPFSGNASFPSAHAASSMAVFSTYARYYGEPLSYFFYTAFATTAFGRIYENKHYLSDVLMGGTIGFVVSSYLYERHKKKDKTGFTPVLFANGKNLFIGFSKYI